MRVPMRLEGTSVLLFGALAVVMGSGCARTPQQKEARFLENGKRMMLRKDYARAALQFRNAVQVMPRDADAQYQLALAELAGGHFADGIDALRKVTELNPGHAGAQVKLAELMAFSGERSAIQEGEKRMQDILRRSPDNIDALNTLALSELQLGKWQDARAHLEQALEEFPQNVSAAVGLARLDLAKHDLGSAEEVLKKAAQAAPQAPEAAVALGQLYRLAGRWDDAEKQFQAAVKINPKLIPGLLGLASSQSQLGRKDQAEQTYRIISMLPEKTYRHLYAAYLLEEGKRDLAVAEFERLVKLDPNDRGARTRMVAAYLFTNRVPDAQRVLSAALKRNAKDVDALLQQSQILLRSGNAKEAEDDLLKALHEQPDSAQGHFLLARVYRAREDVARESLELVEALRHNSALLPARIQLAQRLLEANSARAALDTLDGAPDQQKRILALVIERNWVLLRIGDDAGVRKSVDQGLAVIRVPDLLMQDSILKLRQRDYAGARAAAGEALKQNPEDLRALRVTAASYIAEKQPAAALRAVEEQAVQHPKSAAIQQFLGEWLLANNQTAQARTAFIAAQSLDPKSVSVNMALARLNIAEGKLDEARKTLTGLVASNASGLNVEPRLWLASIETRAGDYQAAIGHFRKVLEADDKNVLALNNLAYLLANYANQPDEALTFAQQARELAPDNLDAEGTLGWVFYRKGLYHPALKYLEEAVAKDAGSSSHNAAIRKYHLAMTYFKLGDRGRGLKNLNAALKIDPDIQRTEIVN